MRKAALIVLIFFNFCLMIGFLVGNALGGAGESPRLGPAPVAGEEQPAVAQSAGGAAGSQVLVSMNPAPTESPTGQRTILIAGVDDLQSAAPALKSVWVLFYIPSSPGLTLVPLYPAMSSNDTQADAALAAAFSLTPEGAPGQSFLDALAAKDVHWSHYAILDQAGLTSLVDSLGGVDLGTEHVDGGAVLNILAALEADAAQNLDRQSALIKGMCVIPGRPGVVIDVPAIFNLLNGHLSTNITIDMVISDWNNLGLAGGQLCKFPTLRSGF